MAAGSAALYSLDILRLAAGTGDHPRLAAPSGTAERRSKACGSRIIVDVTLDGDGRVADYGHDVHACAVGQAAATLIARAAIGRAADELLALSAQLRAYLNDAGAEIPAIEGAQALAPVRAYPARHDAALLAFDAVAAAAMRGASAPA